MSQTSSPNPVLRKLPLGFPWPTLDPFLFCVHHDDAYPRGNEELGPAASLAGRSMGNDFAGIDGWRMYHGRTVPGFPQHPHRGFETVTLARRGLIDHSDSLGAAARFGRGDAQWLTAGKGIVHAEMFPLLDSSQPNPVELFQIWLNLPPEDKFAEPHFTMLWSESIPRVQKQDAQGRNFEVTVVAGKWGKVLPPNPPPQSWASRADSDLAIWTLKLEAGAQGTVPAAKSGTHRVLYLFAGKGLKLVGQTLEPGFGYVLNPETELVLENGSAESEALLLQGRPIGAPVAQYGPFVMNTSEEIQQAFDDYRRTEFGGWPWDKDDPVHGKEQGRFARHADGRREER
jgi:redox-sensitive bicupin YhaK (pirin superfamily)